MPASNRKATALLLSSGLVFQTTGDCLPDNFLSVLAADTIITGVTSVVGVGINALFGLV